MRLFKFPLAVAILFGTLTLSVGAQSDDRSTTELFAGFLHKRLGDEGFNGVNVAGVYNFSRYLGARLDYSYSRGPEYAPFGRQTESNILAGIQIKNNVKEVKKVRPFFHALVGSSRQNLFGYKTDSFTFAIGGGADLRISERVSLRLVQADIQPTYHNSVTRAQARFSFGIVLD